MVLVAMLDCLQFLRITNALVHGCPRISDVRFQTLDAPNVLWEKIREAGFGYRCHGQSQVEILQFGALERWAENSC